MSSCYGLRNQITSITQALNLLGIRNIINIINSISISNSLSENLLLDLTNYWDNSSDVAMASAVISRLTGISTPDEAYLVGLFHNSGIPLLMKKFDSYSTILQQAYQQSTIRITDVENSKLDCNHAVVGYFVGRAWKLPDYLNEAIADHHKCREIFSENFTYDPRKKNLLAILKLAESICHTYSTLGRAKVDHEFDNIKNSLLVYVGLSEYDFEDLRAEIRDMGICNFS
jgi:HD-like signal output (HDOD) protein